MSNWSEFRSRRRKDRRPLSVFYSFASTHTHTSTVTGSRMRKGQVFEASRFVECEYELSRNRNSRGVAVRQSQSEEEGLEIFRHRRVRS